MAAEPWIDHSDPEYWREMVEKDLTLAKAVLKARHYYMAGLKCYEATEHAFCCWFVSGHVVSELPAVHDLTSFSGKIGIAEVLPGGFTELLSALNEFKAVSLTSDAKAEFSAGLSAEYCEKILKETEELCTAAEALAK